MLFWGQKMQLIPSALAELGRLLADERKRQGLSREQAAAVCDVSVSFIRDAENDPGSCSLARLVLLTQGLGLAISFTGWQRTAAETMPGTLQP